MNHTDGAGGVVRDDATAASRALAGITGLMSLALLVYWPLIWRGGFFWDDQELLTGNSHIRAAGWSGLKDIWLSTRNPDYYPVMSTTLWLEWRVWGTWFPQGYHFSNIVLHVCSAILLWRILRLLKVPGAWMAAAVLVVHPVAVESVAWIAERKNTLSLVLMLLALWLYVRQEVGRRSWAGYGLALGFFLLALLSKTAVVGLPVVLLVLVWYRNGRVTKADGYRVIPFAVMSAALAAVTVFFQYARAISDVPIRSDGMASRLAIAARCVWFYLSEALLPVRLCFCYPRWELPARGWLAWLPLAGLVLLIGVLIAARRTAAKHLLVALLCYIVMLGPMLGLMNIFFMRYSLVSDHWQYHALPFVVALVAGILGWWLEHASSMARFVGQVGIGCVIGFMAWYAMYLADVYTSEESIWRHTLANNPSAWLADANLGLSEMETFSFTHDAAVAHRAIEHFTAAVRVAPQMVDNHVNLGNAYLKLSRDADAAAAFEQAKQATEGDARSRAELEMGLGSLCARHAQFDEASGHFRNATRLRPKSGKGYFYLGRALVAMGDQAGAREAFGRAVECDPTDAVFMRALREVGVGSATTQAATLPS